MKKNKIAFQGEQGAYSHIACEILFKDAVIKACPTFEETFRTAYDDENYKIYSVDGMKYYNDNMEACKKKKE